jgi:uncharacterized membrane protein
MSSELIVITYPNPTDAAQVVQLLRRLEAEHLLELEDLVYVTREPDGPISIYERLNRPLAGAALGAFWGTLLGRWFGAPWLGAGIGAAGGMLVSRFHDDGIDDGFVRDLGASLAPGSSAVFALVLRSTADKVLPEVGKFGGTVLHTSLSNEVEAELQAALDDARHKASAVRDATLVPPRARPRRVVHGRV